jgi:hypothetical protein
VSQISPPIRILLVLAVAVLGAYMTVLKPKAEEVPPAEPAPNVQTGAPAESAPGKIAEAAQGAVEASNGQLKSQESVDGVEAGEAAAATGSTTKAGKNGANAAASASAVDVKGLPKPIAKAIRKDKVLVLLFWNGKSADDKAVHKALAHVDRWNGRVYVGSAPIKQIAKYGRIARGVDVEQSPTVVIADSRLRAETLVGYVDSQTIDQAVVDAFRNTTGLFTDAYLRKVDRVCAHHSNVWAAMPNYYVGGSAPKADARIARASKQFSAFVTDFKAVKAPKKWQAYRAAAVADLQSIDSAAVHLSGVLTPKTSNASLIAAATSFNTAARAADKRSTKRFDREGLYRCGSGF